MYITPFVRVILAYKNHLDFAYLFVSAYTCKRMEKKRKANTILLAIVMGVMKGKPEGCGTWRQGRNWQPKIGFHLKAWNKTELHVYVKLFANVYIQDPCSREMLMSIKGLWLENRLTELQPKGRARPKRRRSRYGDQQSVSAELSSQVPCGQSQQIC